MADHRLATNLTLISDNRSRQGSSVGHRAAPGHAPHTSVLVVCPVGWSAESDLPEPIGDLTSHLETGYLKQMVLVWLCRRGGSRQASAETRDVNAQERRFIERNNP